MTEKSSRQFICGNCGNIFPSLQGLTTHAEICFKEDTNDEETSAVENLTLYSNPPTPNSSFQFFIPSASIDGGFEPNEIQIDNLPSSSHENDFGGDSDEKRPRETKIVKKLKSNLNIKPIPIENFADGIRKPMNYKVKCPQCQMIIWRSNFINHYKIHLNAKTAHCTVCDKSFRNNDTLKMHTMSRHSNDDARRYSCDFCQYKAVRRNELRKHTSRVHKNFDETKEISISELKLDEICERIRRKVNSNDFIFLDDDVVEDERLIEFLKYLERNERKNSSKFAETKKIECDVCYRIMCRRNYSIHRRMHSNVYPYECRLCPMKKFRYNSAFNLHMKRHRNENTFKCDRIGCKFSCFYKYQLKKHHEICPPIVNSTENIVRNEIFDDRRKNFTNDDDVENNIKTGENKRYNVRKFVGCEKFRKEKVFTRESSVPSTVNELDHCYGHRRS